MLNPSFYLFLLPLFLNLHFNPRLLYPKLSKNHKSVQKIIFHKYTVVQYIGVLEGWWHVPAAEYRRDFPKRRFRADFMTL